jgi:hypothetical protein
MIKPRKHCLKNEEERVGRMKLKWRVKFVQGVLYICMELL